jgi:UDP-N-acetylmuramate--alanine ligase
MVVHALRAAGLNPGWLIGGSIGGGLANAHWSEGGWLVIEADESDRSMLSLSVEIAVITNVELDHHATYRSLAELNDAFRAFAALARAGIVVWDRPDLLALVPADALAAEAAPAPADKHGPALARFDVPSPTLVPEGSRFDWRSHEVRLSVPGAHNALNAAAALEAARLAGADDAAAIGGLTDFGGAGRRFQLLGSSPRGALVYDDYAHHPTEIAATLDAARTLAHERLIAVFQPHLYSRAALLAADFGRALARADAIVVLDVYPARERAEDHPGVSGLLIAETAADAAGGRPVHWLPRFEDAAPVLEALLGEGDICVVMGAGNVDRLAHGLVGR